MQSLDLGINDKAKLLHGRHLNVSSVATLLTLFISSLLLRIAKEQGTCTSSTANRGLTCHLGFCKSKETLPSRRLPELLENNHLNASA